MKTILLIFLITVSSFIKLNALDEWIKFSVIDNEKISSITTLIVGPKNEIIFPASQKLYIKDSNNFFRIKISNFDDTRLYNLRTFQSKRTNVIWGASDLGFMNYFIDIDSIDFFDRKKIKGDWDYGYITGLTIDSSDNVWFTSRTPYLSKYNGNEFFDFDISMLNKIISINYLRTKLIADKNSNIWITGDDGILCFSTKSTVSDLIYKKYSLKDLSFSGIISDLVYDKKNDILWCSSRKGELGYFDGKIWNRFLIPDSLVAPDINNEPNFITTILIDNSNKIYLFWYSSNFYLIVDGSNIFKYFFPSNIFQDDIQIQSATIDLNQSLWLGTIQDGLIKYNPIPTSVEDNELINVKNDNLLPEIYVRNIYPNPTQNVVNVEMLIYPDNLQELKISIINLLGIEIMDLTKKVNINFSSGESNCNINLEEFNQGVYLFCISKGKDKIVKLIYKYN